MYASVMSARDERPKGPRGGHTTRTRRGMVRKSLWLHADEEAAVRRLAYEERRSESEIMRSAIRAYLGIED